jgi:hypothetical protein
MIGIGIGLTKYFNLGGGGEPPAPFSPLDIPNLKSWHDATQGITLVGGNVNTWADQSGNNYHLTAPTSEQRPSYGPVILNGVPIVDSLMGNKKLYVPNYNLNVTLQGGTIFFVAAQYPGDAAYGRFVSANFGQQFWTGRESNTEAFGGSFLAANPPYGTPQSATNGVFYTAMYLGTTTSSRMSLNGGTLPSPFNYNGTYTPGGMAFFNGADAADSPYDSRKAIAEVIIYDRTLTLSEYTQVLTYLKDKWGHY